MYQKSPLPPGKKGGQNTPNKLTNMGPKSPGNFLSPLYLNRVSFGARQISYECKSLVKLGSRRPNFKNTLEERPQILSWSTSKYRSVSAVWGKIFLKFAEKRVQASERARASRAR